MKQGIVRKIKESRKKAVALFVKLNGLGVIGFNRHYNDSNGKKVISVNRYEQSSRKAG